MSREHILVILGILSAVSPFAGLPLSWLMVLYPVVGVCVALIGITLVRRKKVSVPLAIHEASSPLES